MAPESATAAAPAKVNLFLHVLAREEGGYHGLETLFQAVSLADEVTVRRAASGIALTVDGGVDTGPDDDNLVSRAARLFFGETGEEPAVHVRLRKLIPSAAGLGGGSSDAAATLRALNALHGEPLSRETLLSLAIRLGSDVPFFLCGAALALAWSRGERLLALPPLPARPVLIAHPGVAWPTAEAFRRVAAARAGGYTPHSRALDVETFASWDAVAALAGNDFEPGATDAIRVLESAIAAMRTAGAAIALLSGSGASVFGVFDDAASRDAAGRAVEALGMAAWPAETLSAEVPVRVDFRPVAG